MTEEEASGSSGGGGDEMAAAATEVVPDEGVMGSDNAGYDSGVVVVEDYQATDNDNGSTGVQSSDITSNGINKDDEHVDVNDDEACGSGSSSSSSTPKSDPPPYKSVMYMETDVDTNISTPPPPHPKEEPEEPAWYHVDRDMLICKLSYFFDQMKEASIWPFLVLFHVESGLSTFQAGLINGMRFIGCMVGGPFWGWLADQKRWHRPLIIIVTTCALILQLSQPFVTEHLGPNDLNCCPMKNNKTYKQREEDQKATENTPRQLTMFYTLLGISIVACFFDGTTLSFVDAGVQRKIKTFDRPIDFGRQRMFGSAGYAFGSVLSSSAKKAFFKSSISCYAGAFCVYVSTAIALIFSFNRLFKGANATKETGEAPAAPSTPDIIKSRAPTPPPPARETSGDEPSVNQIIWETVKNPHVLFFMVTVLFNGLMRALVFSFTYLYLKELNAPDLVLGTSMIVSQFASLCFYYLSERIIKVVGGTMQTMALSCFSWVIRLLCLAFMQNYWLIYPINVLNGVSASLFVASSIIHVRKNCRPQAWTAMYGIRNSLFNGGGYILAGVVGGDLYENFGAKRLFLYTCGFCATWVVIMVTYLLIFRNSPSVVAVEMADMSQQQQCEKQEHQQQNGEKVRT